MKINFNRIVLLAGHYGSGKTQIALNFALELRKHHNNVALADLDIVNPYFRTQDSAKMLSENSIRLISSDYAGTNAELPGMTPETAAIFDDKSIQAVIDVGGDDRGALALGRYADKLKNNADILFVFNPYRLQTATAQDALQIMQEIERSGKVKFNGIVFNPNLGNTTTLDDVIIKLPLANNLEEISNIPIVAKAVWDKLDFSPTSSVHDLSVLQQDDWFKISIFSKSEWKI